MTSTLETLIAARALIAEPENWLTGKLAETRDGLDANFAEDDAVAFCDNGAICRVTGYGTEDQGAAWSAAVRALVAAIPPDQLDEGDFPSQTLATFNDTHSHAENLALFTRAIERQRTIDALTSVPSEVRAPAFVGA